MTKTFIIYISLLGTEEEIRQQAESADEACKIVADFHEVPLSAIKRVLMA